MAADKYIAKAICQAQIASDKGKGLYNIGLKNNSDREASYSGYGCKEKYILSAITMIRKTHSNVFNYYCIKDNDQNGYDSIITYFDIKLPEGRFQVSFHTPYSKSSDELDKLVGTGRKTRWNKKYGGSIEGCEALIAHYNL